MIDKRRTIAREKGEKRFIPTLPCPKCGTSLKYTASGVCVACHDSRRTARWLKSKAAERARRLLATEHKGA